MKLACIDIGSNSVKLLVVLTKGREIVKILLQRTATTRLGQGVDKNHELLPEAMDRTLNAIEAFKQNAETIEPHEIIAVATSAVRDASNQDEFVQKVIDRTGLNPMVISGEEEAKYTYIGACSNPELRSKKLLLVNVGGGSSDFVLGENYVVEDAFSVKTGFIRLTEEFIHSDPVTPDELQKVTQRAREMLIDQLAGITMDGRHLAGSGGTIAILASIFYHLIGKAIPTNNDRWFLQRTEIRAILRYLSRMKSADRQNVIGLPLDRADIIVAGAAIYSAIMEVSGAAEIDISTKGMREGVLLSQLFLTANER